MATLPAVDTAANVHFDPLYISARLTVWNLLKRFAACYSNIIACGNNRVDNVTLHVLLPGVLICAVGGGVDVATIHLPSLDVFTPVSYANDHM